jgi:hypothetical protein
MRITRRHFLEESVIKGGSFLCLNTLLGNTTSIKVEIGKEIEFEVIQGKYLPNQIYFAVSKPVASIARINEKLSSAKGIHDAVLEAIDLIGGIKTTTKGKERIPIKPNLVGPNVTDTKKAQVAESLAALMKKAGMKPPSLENIEIVGRKIDEVKRSFKRPAVVPYTMIKDWYGPACKNGRI